MQCRSCGTEIAANALICYRCGTATTEAKFKPVAVSKGGSWSTMLLWLLAAALLVLAAWFLVHSTGSPRAGRGPGDLAPAVRVMWRLDWTRVSPGTDL